MATAKVLIAMADYGHDPTGKSSSESSEILAHAEQVQETAVPYAAFKQAGFEVQFATENGKAPECDRKMLRGIIQKLLVSILSSASEELITPPSIFVNI
jgi:putative intracellular protease/amidase